MIHYTILPQDIVFSTDEKGAQQQIIDIDQVKLVVKPKEDKWEIIQLISSNPNDFLNEQYQPGQMISLKPSFSS